MRLLIICFLQAFALMLASPPDLEKANSGHSGNSDDCETVVTTVTLTDPPGQASSTFVYTSTVVVPGAEAQTVTKTAIASDGVVLETVLLTGTTETITIFTTKTSYPKATTTSTSTTTYTTYPNASVSVTSTDTVVVFVEGTLTVTYPGIISVNSVYKYTGAPTSLWLSVI